MWLLLPSIVLVSMWMFLASILVRIYWGKKDRTQVWMFLLVSGTLAAWSVVNSGVEVFSDIAENVPIINSLNALGFLLGGLAAVLIFVFSYFYPKRIQIGLPRAILTFVLFALLPLAASAGVAGEYYFDAEKGAIEYSYGDQRLHYILIVVITIVFAVIQMGKALRDPSLRTKHFKAVSLGALLTALHGLFFAAILVAIFGYSSVLFIISYMAPAYMIIATSYSFIKQEMFDVKAVLKKSALYLLSSVVFVLLFLVPVFIIASITGLHDFTSSEAAFIIGVSVLLVLVYHPARHWFDRRTTKLVTDDTFQAQFLLDELNKALVLEMDLESLLEAVNKILEKNLKTTHSGFYIRETSYSSYRFICRNYANEPTKHDLDQIRQVMSVIDRKVFSVNQEAASIDEKLLAELLRNSDNEILCRLVNTTELKVAGVGYFLIGPKRNGAAYSTNDLKIMEIIANELVIAIENSLRFEEIEQFNVTLQKKIDAATNELKQSNIKLLALDEAKDEFVSMASHQLRTPLTSIKGYISMVLDGDVGKVTEPQSKLLAQALYSSQRMVYLIADLLNVSRLKTGKFVIDTKPVYLPDVIDSELRQLQEAASARNLTLSYESPKEFPTLKLDDTKIRQVIMNMVDNAIYYTPAGGKISVELKNKRESVEFRVKDSGIGVPKDEQHKLFGQFYRAENARKARPDGTGIGLFMAKKIIIAQGGSIIFESKQGKGSTFGFTFPKTKVEIVKTKQAE